VCVRLIDAGMRVGYLPRDELIPSDDPYGESKASGRASCDASVRSIPWVIHADIGLGPWFDVPYRKFLQCGCPRVVPHPTVFAFGEATASCTMLLFILSNWQENVEHDAAGRVVLCGRLRAVELRAWAEKIRRHERSEIRDVPLSLLVRWAGVGDALKRLGISNPPELVSAA